MNSNSGTRSLSGSTAAAATIFVTGLLSVAPTISSAHGLSASPRVPAIVGTAVGGSRDGRSRANATANTAAYVSIESIYPSNTISAETEQLVRPTSQVELIVGVLRSWGGHAKNWDHEGAEKPIAASLHNAESLVFALGQIGSTVLDHFEPVLHPSGHAGLFWQDSDRYVDLEFLGNGKMAYFIEKGLDRHKGSVVYDSQNTPGILKELLQS